MHIADDAPFDGNTRWELALSRSKEMVLLVFLDIGLKRLVGVDVSKRGPTPLIWVSTTLMYTRHGSSYCAVQVVQVNIRGSTQVKHHIMHRGGHLNNRMVCQALRLSHRLLCVASSQCGSWHLGSTKEKQNGNNYSRYIQKVGCFRRSSCSPGCQSSWWILLASACILLGHSAQRSEHHLVPPPHLRVHMSYAQFTSADSPGKV